MGTSKGAVRLRLEMRTMLAFSLGGTYDGIVLSECLTSLSEAVVSKHYSGYRDREELVSVGIEKALSLLRAPFLDPSKNIRAFLYTGIRNEVGNLIRKEARMTPVPPRSPSFGALEDREDEVHLSIEFERQYAQILARLKACGATQVPYLNIARGAAIYRAVA